MGGPLEGAESEFGAALTGFVREHRVAGAVAGIVHGDTLAWSGGAGFGDLGAGRPSSPDAVYSIASITKTFTGTAVMRLRDAGRLGLDDPAVDWLPELRETPAPFGPIEGVTIRRMLSHESGLAADPPGTDWTVPVYETVTARTLARARELEIRIPPNLRSSYSNLAYQLLGEIVTRASGTAYPEYVRTSILDPLGLKSTAFGPLSGALLARQATGYGERALSDEIDPAPLMSADWAEGGLWSSVGDLAAWLSFQLAAYRDPTSPGEGGVAQQPPVLAAASLREMHRPRYLADDAWNSAWGISWSALRKEDTVWMTHSGWLPGFTSAVVFEPVAQVGAVLLVNGTGPATPCAVELASIARRAALAAPPVLSLPAPTPEAYRPLLGLYARPELNWTARVEWRDRQLTVTSPQTPGWSVPLEPTGDPDVFAGGPESDAAAERVRFTRLPDGRGGSMHLFSSTLIRLDPVAAPP